MKFIQIKMIDRSWFRLDGVKFMLQQQLFNEHVPDSPRLFTVQEIDVHLACKLNRMWHSRLPIIHWSNVVRSKKHICYGLFFDGLCWATAIFSSPIARALDGGTILELRRYAIKDGAPKNTASWGLGQMTKMIRDKFPDVEKLISYQDVAVHKGTIYKASNWSPSATTKFASWENSRKRNAAQATGDKIRWEYVI